MFDRTKSKSVSTPPTETAAAPVNPVPVTPSPARNAAMIGPSIVIKGEVTGEEDLLIQGKVEGKIDLKGNQVSIGSSGDVRADISAKVIQIDGNVTGDISASEKVTISKSGNVHGNIVAPRVTLEDGALFKGSIDMDPAGASANSAATNSATTNNASVLPHQSAAAASPQLKASGLDLKSV
jgi:cytoskeletal protein CcmA (bactofilin family)